MATATGLLKKVITGTVKPALPRHLSSSEVGLTKDQLVHGDHLYVLRRTAAVFEVPDGPEEEKYLYSHHGIYDKENDTVIHFSRPDEDNASNEEEDNTSPREKNAVERSMTGYMGSMVMRLTGFGKGFLIQKTKNGLCKFNVSNDEQEMKFFRYSYGRKPDEGQLGTSTEANFRTGEEDFFAVKTARWFAKHQLFGQYDMQNWNCEHFATFCKTTNFSIGELNRFLNSKEEDRDFWLDRSSESNPCIPQHVLKRKSEAQSIQTRLFE